MNRLQHPTFTLSRRQWLGSVAAAGTAVAMPSLARARSAAEASAAWPGVQGLLNDYVGGGKVANMVAGLGYGTAAPDFLASGDTSFTSGLEAGPDTLYRIYSMTKPITGMATIMCIDDGLLSLDQPIADMLPAFADMKVQKEYDGAITADNLEPAVRPITVRHCLTHTAGLGYSIVQQGPLAEAYNEAGLVPGVVSRLETPGIFRGQAVEGLAEFAERLATMPLVLQPGTRWSYSVGLDLMGRVIEVATGKTFDAFLQERIFDPVGMTSTFFQLPESEKHRFTANYFVADGQLLPIDLPDNSVYLDKPAFPFGGAGLVSTSRDYDRFLQMLANYGKIDGKQVMSEPAVRLATSDLFADTVSQEGRFQFGERTFGFGAAGLVGTGDAEGLFGWFGAAGTCGLVNMKYGLRQNLMTQYMPSQDYPLQNDFPVVVATDAAAQAART